MAKERAKGATGSCTLYTKIDWDVRHGNVRFAFRNDDGDRTCGYVPAAVAIESNLSFLERLPEISMDAALKAQDALKRAIDSVPNVFDLRPRHRS